MRSKNWQSLFFLWHGHFFGTLDSESIGSGGLVDGSQKVGEAVLTRGRENSWSLAEGCLPEVLPRVLLGGGQEGLLHKPLDLEGPYCLDGQVVVVVVAGVEGSGLPSVDQRQQGGDAPDGTTEHRPGS